jgi:hypothetical protein
MRNTDAGMPMPPAETQLWPCVVWVKKHIYKSKRKIRDAVVLFVAFFDMAFAKNRRDGIKRCKVMLNLSENVKISGM